jgi:hypothetical protein
MIVPPEHCADESAVAIRLTRSVCCPGVSTWIASQFAFSASAISIVDRKTRSSLDEPLIAAMTQGFSTLCLLMFDDVGVSRR